MYGDATVASHPFGMRGVCLLTLCGLLQRLVHKNPTHWTRHVEGWFRSIQPKQRVRALPLVRVQSVPDRQYIALVQQCGVCLLQVCQEDTQTQSEYSRTPWGKLECCCGTEGTWCVRQTCACQMWEILYSPSREPCLRNLCNRSGTHFTNNQKNADC